MHSWYLLLWMRSIKISTNNIRTDTPMPPSTIKNMGAAYLKLTLRITFCAIHGSCLLNQYRWCLDTWPVSIIQIYLEGKNSLLNEFSLKKTMVTSLRFKSIPVWRPSLQEDGKWFLRHEVYHIYITNFVRCVILVHEYICNGNFTMIGEPPISGFLNSFICW